MPAPLTRAYDGAPREITEQEARAVAEREYGYHRSDFRDGWVIWRMGADGGRHLHATASSKAEADRQTEIARASLVSRLMAGACTHTCFYDRARDRFYIA